jgi:TP901 family phage tail tape measure protein
MADVESNIHVNIDTSDALASLKLLQRQISAFHTSMAKSGTAAAAVAANQAQNLMNSINATGQFQASMRTVTSSTESFTNALEKNKLTSREYFRYTGAATKTFGRLFKSEFETINKVARERVKDLQTQYIKMGRGANGALQAIAVRPLTLDMKNLGTQTAIAAQRQQLLNQLLKQGSTNLLNFGKNTQWAGRQLMVGFTVPLLMLGTQAAKTFMALEEQAIRFKRVYGEMFTTQEETDLMVKNIQLLAKEYTKYGVAVEDTMKMAADAAAMGKMGADLTAQISEATRLAVLGGVEQAQALETTISVTNAFGVAADELAGKIDFLNAVENQTVVSIEDLTVAIPKAGPVVKQLGGNVEDLAFFLTAMKEGGINASEGANALKSGLASLINPSEKASKFLGGLGVNIKGIVEANKGDIKNTVIGFAQALDTLDPLNRARAIEQLFGKFQFSRLSTLFQNVTAQGTQASRVLELTKATTEELAILSERELNKIENTTTYKFKKSMEDLKVAIAPVGEQFLKALTPIVEFVGKILDKFNNLGDGSKKFLTILTVALGAIGPLALMSFGLLANGIANIIKLFAGLKSVFNRAGSSTQILGQQTSYLTQEQVEASAIAASLDQVHQRLRQTFTSEATAVNTLASAYRNAIAAQLGFTGPVRGKPVISQAAKKYSTGTTRVPGTGNKDTVPSVLTPGEAVIPADVAQDPQFKPIINAMVNRRLKGFNGGTTYASQSEQATEKLQFAHATAKKVVNLDEVDDEFKKKAQELKARGLKEANAYSGLGFDIPEKLHGELRENKASLDEYLEEIKKPRSIQTMTENLMKKNPQLSASEAAKVTDKIRRELISSLELIPRVSTADGLKPHLIGDDLVASRVGDLKSGIVGGLVEDKKYSDAVKRVFGAAGISGKGTPKVIYDKVPATPAQLLEAVKKTGQQSIVTAVQRLVDNHPNAEVLVKRDAKGNIVSFSRPEVSRKPPYELKTTRNSGELVDGKFNVGRADGSSGAVKVAGTASKAIRQAVARQLFGLPSAELEGKTITTYAKQIAEGTGFSNIGAKHLSGIHETLDGKKVFVKPMMDLKSALAEQRATQIARDVHGLDAPNQQLRIIQDPITGKTMYALESAFDSKFDPSKMSNTFTKEDYIRQNVAAALRADKDLGKGNLSGNILADVGPAGVFSTASGERNFATNLPSMEEQAIKNLDLSLTEKNRKKFFAEATADLARSMTPEEYDKAMKDEINRVLPKLKETVATFDLDKNEKKVYNAMIKRLEDGLKVDWKEVHKRHVSIKDKIAVKPDEMQQEDKTQKLTKPKMEPLPANVKSAAGKEDTMMTDKPKKGRRIVNMPKRVRRGPRGIIMPGQADAPMASGVVSMPGSARKLSELTSAYVKGAIADAATAKAAGKQIGTTIANASAEETKIVSKKRVRRATRAAGPAPIGPEMPAGAVGLPLVSRPEPSTATPGPNGRIGRYLAGREEKRSARIAAGKGPGMGMGGGVMAASGVAMVGSMVPGTIGDIAQKLMMPLMGLSMILPLVQNKFGALAVGIGAVVAAYAYSKIQFDKAQNSAFDLAISMGVGRDAMLELSKAAGKVSAGEQMDRRRSNKFSILPIQNGKSTFGQSFVKQDAGKEMLKNIGKNGGATASVSATSAQLQNAVMSGSMSLDQAKSVAANLGEQLGDYTFGIKVIGSLTELLGPDGENLEKNPLEVRIKMIQDAQSRVNFASDASNAASNGNKARKDNILGVSDNIQEVGGTLAGAGAGALAGAIIGQILIPIPGVGAAIGALAGTVIGSVAGGIMGEVNKKKRIAAATGASVAQDKMALEQGQEMIDSFDLQYQKKIELLRTQGKINEAVALENKYYADRDKLLAANKQTKDIILSNYSNSGTDVQKAYMTGTDKAVTKKYKNTVYEDMVPLAQSSINDSQLTDKQKLSLKLEMESGNFNPNDMINMFKVFTNKADQEIVLGMVGKFGGKFAAETISVVNGFGDNAKLKKDYLIQIKSKSGKDAQKFQDFFGQLSMYGNNIPADISVDYFLKNPAAQKSVQGIIDKINEKDGKMGLDFVLSTLGAEGLAAVNADLAYWNTLDAASQKVYTTAIAYQLKLEGDPDQQAAFKAWQAENKGKMPTEYINFAQTKAEAITKSAADNTLSTVPGDGGGGGAKVETSPLDELLKKLRDVRKNQISVTAGWGASQKALNKLFGGSKTIEIFSGIENDMRKLGAGEDLIDLITGMDPKEYEKRKKSLFEFDAKGNISKIKDNARSIGDAIASISLGEFVSDQERMSKQIGNQTTALTRLKAAGVEGSVALEAVADATLAAALANKKLSDAQIKKITDAWKKATKEKNNYAAVQTIEQEKAALKERVDLLSRMVELQSTFNEEQRSAIMDSAELQSALVKIASVKPGDKTFKDFMDLLEKTINKNKTEIKLKQLTISGLQEIFDNGFNAAMDQADVKEKTLQLNFEANTRGLQNAIDLAQDEIADWQYKIDDQEAMLRGIEKQEQKINDKYDERIQALDEVEKANAAISAQQKGQLTLAEALTSGDIAAAARAAQEMRTQAAADAVTKEKEALQKSRDYELSQVRQDGKSRKDIENEITRLQDLVYAKEEIIEKDQEEIRQKEVALREAIKPIDVERARWEAMQNDIDIARTNNAKFLKIMADAEAVVEELKKRYWALKPDTDPIIPAGTLVCPAGTKDDGNGNCVPTVVGDPGTCPPGMFMNAEGKCYKKSEAEDGPDPKVCPPGMKMGLNDKCIPDTTTNPSCPPGYFMNADGKCYKGSDSTTPGNKGTGKVTPQGFEETPADAYKPTWMNIDDPTARAHVKDMETNIAANIVRNSELFNREVNKLKIEDNAGSVAKNHYVDLNRLTDQMNLAKKYNTGPDYAKQQAENLAANKAAAAKKAQDEANLKKFGGNASAANAFGNWGNWSMGGLIPKFFALGGFAKGTDTVPAMLTPGEFIMSKYAVDSYGVDTMRKINKGDSVGGSVYNNTYALTVNAKTDANPNDIAQAVMSTIKRVDERRIRGVSLNGR